MNVELYTVRIVSRWPRREEDEHGDEREFTECIAAWQETGGLSHRWSGGDL